MSAFKFLYIYLLQACRHNSLYG